jgi:hypothetical protein
VRSAFFLPTTVDSIFQHRLFWYPADAKGAVMAQTAPAKKRVNVYVDGFNLYHSALQHTYSECRWLNLLELSKRLINPKTEEIQTVYYFSAITTWNPDRAKKHLQYIHALRTVRTCYLQR